MGSETWWRPTWAPGSQGRSCASGTTATLTASSLMTRGRRTWGARWTRMLSCARGGDEGDGATFWRVTLRVGLLHIFAVRGVICKQLDNQCSSSCTVRMEQALYSGALSIDSELLPAWLTEKVA